MAVPLSAAALLAVAPRPDRRPVQTRVFCQAEVSAILVCGIGDIDALPDDPDDEFRGEDHDGERE